MNTSFRKWLEIQEVSAADLAMMMTTMSPGHTKPFVQRPLMMQSKEASEIKNEIRNVAEQVVKIQNEWPATKQKILLSIQNKTIHPLDLFGKMMAKDPKALRKILSLDMLEQRFDQIEDLVTLVNTKIHQIENDILKGPEDEMKLDMQTRLKRREKRIDNLRILSNTLDNVQRFIDDYKKPARDEEEQAKLDEKTVAQMDVLAALNLEFAGKLIQDLSR
jgi:hypothetical protein